MKIKLNDDRSCYTCFLEGNPAKIKLSIGIRNKKPENPASFNRLNPNDIKVNKMSIV